MLLLLFFYFSNIIHVTVTLDVRDIYNTQHYRAAWQYDSTIRYPCYSPTGGCIARLAQYTTVACMWYVADVFGERATLE